MSSSRLPFSFVMVSIDIVVAAVLVLKLQLQMFLRAIYSLLVVVGHVYGYCTTVYTVHVATYLPQQPH